VRLRVQAPERSALRATTASGDLRTRGPLGAVEVKSASGDVELDEVDALEAKVASGDVEVDQVVGEARIDSASGDVEIGEVGGGVTVRTASGDQVVRSVAQGRVDLTVGLGRHPPRHQAGLARLDRRTLDERGRLLGARARGRGRHAEEGRWSRRR
jgi:hypothetical protein